MSTQAWDLLATPQQTENSAWELFHENSKLTPHDQLMAEQLAQIYMAQMPESLILDGYQDIQLPDVDQLGGFSLRDAILSKTVTKELEPCSMNLDMAATLLRCAYGVTSAAEETESGRRRRSVYSEGALFPLELFVHCARVAGLAPGLYHYYPPGNILRLLRKGDQSQKLAAGFLDSRCVQAASMTVFVTAVPERSVLRFGERGYRFALMEAGAVVQSLNLAAAAMGLNCANTGEFFDSEVDDVLDLDGLSISTLYAVGIGKSPGDAQNAAGTGLAAK